MTLAWARLILAAAIFITPVTGLAATWMQPATGADASGAREFYVVEPEEGQWLAARFRAESGELQDREAQSRWETELEALDAAESMGLDPSRAIPWDPVEEPEAPVAADSPGGIWKATEAWSEDWERAYSAWIEKEVGLDFFQKHGIRTDCADVPIALRWIFARIHALPAGSRLSGSGALLTHESSRASWKKLPTAALWHEDERFLAALEYLLENTYTHSLFKDAYPVAIEGRWLEPGAIQLELRSSDGHAAVVRELDVTAPARSAMILVYSTVPKIVRELRWSGYWQRDPPAPGRGGLLRFRWTEKSGSSWRNRAPDAMPGYSLEQYDPGFVGGDRSFSDAVLKRIKPAFDVPARLEEGIAELRSLVLSRRSVVEQGWIVCQEISCAPGTQGWEDWSTPSRDKRLGDTFAVIEGFVEEYELSVPALAPRWAEAGAEPLFELEGFPVTLAFVRQAWKEGAYSSDPRKEPRVRWGVPSLRASRAGR